MYKNKAVIDEIISIIKDEIAKNNIYTNMGTSVDEGMSHQQSNYIKKHFNDLLNELKDINISSIDDTITGAQLQQLYKSGKAKYNWPEFSFDEKYQYDVFKLLSNPSEREIPVREFIKEYILLEEKLGIKRAKVLSVHDDLKPLKMKYKEQLDRHRANETKGIQLGVTLFELKEKNYTNDDGNYAIKLKVEDFLETSETSTMINGKVVWNKNYSFNLKNRNDTLEVELYKKTAILPFALIGSIRIDLEKISKDQQQLESEFDLLSISDSNVIVAKLRMKLHYVYDTIKYFETLYNKVSYVLSVADEVLNHLQKYNEMLSKPYGIIMNGDLFDLINDEELFDKIEMIEDVSANVRMSVMTVPRTSQENKRVASDLLTSGEIFFKNKIINAQFDKLTFILIAISIMLNLIMVIARNSLLSMVIVAIVGVVGVSNLRDKKVLTFLFYGLIMIEVFDVFWFFSGYRTFWNRLNEENSISNLRKWIYIFGLVDIFIKGEICFVVNKERKK